MSELRWTRWQELMVAGKERAGLSYLDVAARLGPGFHPDTIRNYFVGKAKPPLELLHPIAEAVSVEPEEGLVALGLLAAQLARVVLELARLRRRTVDLEARLRAAPGTSSVGGVIEDALASGCAVGVWPGSEGDRFGRISVGNRLTIIPLHQDTLPPSLVESLSVQGAVRVRSSTRSADIDHLRPEGWPDYELWSLPTLTAARPVAHRPRITGDPRSILITSLTLSASPNDVGSLVAAALGFGFTSTREARSVLYGGRGGGRDLNAQRNQAALLALRDRELRDRWVWSHFGAPVLDLVTGADIEPFAATELLSDAPPPGLWFVWLRETPSLLKIHVQRSETRFTVKDLIEFQERIEGALRSWAGQATVVTTDAPDEGRSLRDGLMDRSILIAADLLGRLETTYGLRFIRELLDDPDVLQPLRRALDDRAGYSSSSSSSSSK